MNRTSACLHRWRYLVNTKLGAIRARRCEHCGAEAPLASEMQPAIPPPLSM